MKTLIRFFRNKYRMPFKNDVSTLFTQSTRHASNLLVMIHAFPLNSSMYLPIAERLHPDWRMLLIDLPGFGKSPAYTNRRIALMEDYASLIYELLLDESYSYLVIGGVSMGGYVTLAFERMFPNVSDAIILSNTKAINDPDNGKTRYELIEKIEKEGKKPVIDKYFPKMYAPETYEKDKSAVAFLEKLYEEASIEGIIQAQAGMARRLDHTNLLGEINKKTLLIAGEKDTVTPVSDLKYMADRLNKKELKIIPSAGHLACIEKPDKYAEIVNEFLISIKD